MKANLVVLNTQETQFDFGSKIEPRLVKNFAQNGVDITKATIFNRAEDFQKSLFGLLESCSIVLFDLSISGADSVFKAIDQFYSCRSQNFSQGKGWTSSDGRHCVVFDLNNPNFAEALDTNFLKQKFAGSKFLYIIKTYGLDHSEIRNILNNLPNPQDFDFCVTSSFLDCEIDILAENKWLNSKEFDEFLRNVYEKLKDYMYSDTDASLYDKLSELLTLRNMCISVSDSLTSGLFEKLLSENLENFDKRVCAFYSIMEKSDFITLLKMDAQLLNLHDVESIDMAYEIAASMLEDSDADIVLSLSGTSQRPFIAIGDRISIHVYRFNFNHSSDFINNVMIQTSLFKLLKKLIKNDLLF